MAIHPKINSALFYADPACDSLISFNSITIMNFSIIWVMLSMISYRKKLGINLILSACSVFFQRTDYSLLIFYSFNPDVEDYWYSNQ